MLKTIAIVVGGVIFTVLFLGMAARDVRSDAIARCKAAWQDSGLEYRYLNRYAGCQVKVGKGWIPAENYRPGS